MTNPDRPSSPPPQPLEYAGRPDAPPPTSRLAVASLVAAVLCSPCLLGPLLDLLRKYLPQSFRQSGLRDEWVFRGALILATALPAAALLRIRFSRRSHRSHRSRRGAAPALLALAVVLLWWPLLLLVPTELPNPN